MLYEDESGSPRLNSVDREAAFRAGEGLALWDEILICEELNMPKPEWARLALIEYAKTKLASIKSKTGKGCKARAREEQLQLWDDLLVFISVNAWREEYWRTRAGKTRQFSWRQAFIRAARERGHHNHTSEAWARVAYKRAEKRNKEGFYASELFLRTVSIKLPPLA